MKFRFVDKIVAWSPQTSIRGIKAVSFEEYCLKEAFGGEARLPETLLLESFLQLGNWLIVLSSDFAQCGMVVRLSEVRFEGSLRPGEHVEMDIAVVQRRDDGWELSGKGRVNGRTVIRGLGCLAIPVPAADLFDPADLRVLFSEIYQPAEAVAP
jgi:3-hydroxymyristoyl/3-hydroxydecanoyl-(acyl carrier protein) dehydratase